MTIKVTKYQKSERDGAFVASFSIIVPKWGNVFINRLKLFRKGEHFWIKFPEEKYNKDGEDKYFPYMGFVDRSFGDKFQELVLKAIEEYAKENALKEQQSQSNHSSNDDELPF